MGNKISSENKSYVFLRLTPTWIKIEPDYTENSMKSRIKPHKNQSDTNFVSQPNLDNDLRQTITLVLQALSKSNFVSSIKHNFKNKLDDFILYLNFDRDTKLDLEKACQTRVTVCALVMIQIMLCGQCLVLKTLGWQGLWTTWSLRLLLKCYELTSLKA